MRARHHWINGLDRDDQFPQIPPFREDSLLRSYPVTATILLFMGDYLTGDIGNSQHPCMPPISGSPGDSWTCECGESWMFTMVAGYEWASWQRISSPQTFD